MTTQDDQDIWKAFTKQIDPLDKTKGAGSTRLNDKVNPYRDQTGQNHIDQKTGQVKLKPVKVKLQAYQAGDYFKTREPSLQPVLDLRTQDFKYLKVEAAIDLHGLTQVKAQEALLAFFDISKAMGRKYVLVITGKGKPDTESVLRIFAQQWFKDNSLYVVGYCVALPKDGGDGAFYVHVRRDRGQ